MADKQDEKLLKRLNACWEEGKKMRDIISKDWDNNPEMLKGDQLAKNRPAHKPPAVLNKLRSVAERKIALLTDTKPKFSVTPGKSGTGYPKVSDVLKDPKWPEEAFFRPTDFQRQDESTDTSFYNSPRFVTHIDDPAIKALTGTSYSLYLAILITSLSYSV